MNITTIIGNIDQINIGIRSIETISIEWYECNKRILNKKTSNNTEITLRFLQQHAPLLEGDILFMDQNTVITVNILPCEVIEITPLNMQEMAAVCYEIGNKHLPLFIEEDQLLIPFDAPLFKLLQKNKYTVNKTIRKLIHPLSTTVQPHNEPADRKSLFSMIMKMTNTNE